MGLFDAPAFARRGQELEESPCGAARALPPGPRRSPRHGPGPAPPVVRVRDRPGGLDLRLRRSRSSRSGRSPRPSRRSGPLRRAPPSSVRGHAGTSSPPSSGSIAAGPQFLESIQPRAGESRDRPLQPLLCPGEGVRDGLGAARGPVSSRPCPMITPRPLLRDHPAVARSRACVDRGRFG